MASKLNELAKSTTERIAAKAEAKFHEAGSLEWMLRVAQMAGAATFADNATQAMNAQAIRGWEMFQQEEGYKAFPGKDGEPCKDFAQYLDKYRPNGLTKARYYDRKNLLEKEGDEVFNLLNSLSVPATSRLALTSGDIEIKEDEIILGGKAAPMGDKKQIKALFKEISTAFESAEAKATKDKKALHKQMKRAGFAFGKDEEGNEVITPPPAAPVSFDKHTVGDHINHLYLVALSSLNELTCALVDSEADEATGRLEQYRVPLQQAFRDLMASTKAQRAPAGTGGSLADLLSDDDLAELAEDDD